ncbi:MAG: alpha/beta hydrolase [Chitinispirillaceae bacterium]|nr:alpha/beta hydrolase [Chitinispirillaceae bacterium]
MLGFMLKRILSLAISIATIYVPQEQWQEKLDSLPDQSERSARNAFGGWQSGTTFSPYTGLKHYYYRYPCADTASRRVLLLLHGFNTDGSIFFNLAPLADTRTLIAYNFPEQTDLFTGSMRDFEDILDDFCTVMHFDTVDLLGNSLGGIIATFYAAHTGRMTVRSIVLASTYVHGATKENVRQVRGMADKLLPYPDYKLFYLLSLGSRLSERIEKGNSGKDSLLGTVVIKRIAWYRQILKMLYWYDGVGDARKLTCPVLVLHGADDRLVPQEEVEATRRTIPRSEVKIFAKAGHSLIFSHARECMAAIRDFGGKEGSVASAR